MKLHRSAFEHGLRLDDIALLLDGQGRTRAVEARKQYRDLLP